LGMAACATALPPASLGTLFLPACLGHGVLDDLHAQAAGSRQQLLSPASSGVPERQQQAAKRGQRGRTLCKHIRSQCSSSTHLPAHPPSRPPSRNCEQPSPPPPARTACQPTRYSGSAVNPGWRVTACSSAAAASEKRPRAYRASIRRMGACTGGQRARGMQNIHPSGAQEMEGGRAGNKEAKALQPGSWRLPCAAHTTGVLQRPQTVKQPPSRGHSHCGSPRVHCPPPGAHAAAPPRGVPSPGRQPQHCCAAGGRRARKPAPGPACTCQAHPGGRRRLPGCCPPSASARGGRGSVVGPLGGGAGSSGSQEPGNARGTVRPGATCPAVLGVDWWMRLRGSCASFSARASRCRRSAARSREEEGGWAGEQRGERGVGAARDPLRSTCLRDLDQCVRHVHVALRPDDVQQVGRGGHVQQHLLLGQEHHVGAVAAVACACCEWGSGAGLVGARVGGATAGAARLEQAPWLTHPGSRSPGRSARTGPGPEQI